MAAGQVGPQREPGETAAEFAARLDTLMRTCCRCAAVYPRIADTDRCEQAHERQALVEKRRRDGQRSIPTG